MCVKSVDSYCRAKQASSEGWWGSIRVPSSLSPLASRLPCSLNLLTWKNLRAVTVLTLAMTASPCLTPPCLCPALFCPALPCPTLFYILVVSSPVILCSVVSCIPCLPFPYPVELSLRSCPVFPVNVPSCMDCSLMTHLCPPPPPPAAAVGS